MDKNAANVVDYYRYCEIAYNCLWRDKKSLGTHLGFWQPTTKTHAESLMEQNKEMVRVLAKSAKKTSFWTQDAAWAERHSG
ncbi:MAG: hypothetical protein QF486_02675 [Candidatus Woesearchaeota archaeon]|jgi:hypothetical protein|nr:hypothetical protein [Candidatus Woesearchaeota archaeon]MDP7181458.1 hypothetical protein [Candidatus Woesearchaeota archaeon]MDP7198500.1 hypothetical protein [Candidatus Woesearchaeota archaeon]MDP7466758.1 hypothetical protein [Candidatus Woesearchaeota archaeon]MDP7647983.1 hypothetical protein [Candidatus Woesearchaeota archaeon]